MNSDLLKYATTTSQYITCIIIFTETKIAWLGLQSTQILNKSHRAPYIFGSHACGLTRQQASYYVSVLVQKRSASILKVCAYDVVCELK